MPQKSTRRKTDPNKGKERDVSKEASMLPEEDDPSGASSSSQSTSSKKSHAAARDSLHSRTKANPKASGNVKYGTQGGGSVKTTVIADPREGKSIIYDFYLNKRGNTHISFNFSILATEKNIWFSGMSASAFDGLGANFAGITKNKANIKVELVRHPITLERSVHFTGPTEGLSAQKFMQSARVMILCFMDEVNFGDAIQKTRFVDLLPDFSKDFTSLEIELSGSDYFNSTISYHGKIYDDVHAAVGVAARLASSMEDGGIFQPSQHQQVNADVAEDHAASAPYADDIGSTTTTTNSASSTTTTREDDGSSQNLLKNSNSCDTDV